jgi:hypothetical protein
MDRFRFDGGIRQRSNRQVWTNQTTPSKPQDDARLCCTAPGGVKSPPIKPPPSPPTCRSCRASAAACPRSGSRSPWPRRGGARGSCRRRGRAWRQTCGWLCRGLVVVLLIRWRGSRRWGALNQLQAIAHRCRWSKSPSPNQGKGVPRSPPVPVPPRALHVLHQQVEGALEVGLGG